VNTPTSTFSRLNLILLEKVSMLGITRLALPDDVVVDDFGVVGGVATVVWWGFFSYLHEF